MAYRNGTYIAFHAQGTNVPIDSDIKYYNLMKAWTAKGDDDFSMIDSHDKTYAVGDSSKKEALMARLRERLRNSKNMVLIIGSTTKLDTDWLPFEIEYAVDVCDIPISVTYIDYEGAIFKPDSFAHLWPGALKKRIENGKASCIHITFKKGPIQDAISQFSHTNKPAYNYYSVEAYKSFGIPV
jgi:hypothetical protein